MILKGTVDATLAANLPASPVGGDAYRVSVAGDFEGSALIHPAGSYFDIGNYVVWNAIAGDWDKIDNTENISDSAYDATAWDGVTRDAPSKNAMRDKIFAMDASIAVVSNEADNIEVAMGLDTDGTWIAHSGTNYIDAATTGKNARELLDTTIFNVSGELNTVEASAGFNADGTMPAFSGTVGLDEEATHKAALEAIDGYIGDIHPNGFEVPSNFTPAYDSTSRVFTLTAAADGYLWCGDIRRKITAGAHVTTAHATTTGLWWLVCRTGTLTATLALDFDTDAIIAGAYYNATTPSYAVL